MALPFPARPFGEGAHPLGLAQDTIPTPRRSSPFFSCLPTRSRLLLLDRDGFVDVPGVNGRLGQLLDHALNIGLARLDAHYALLNSMIAAPPAARGSQCRAQASIRPRRWSSRSVRR